MQSKLEHPWFTEGAMQAAILFRHHSGASGRYFLPEMMSGGVGLLDYDSDGLMDIYIVQAGALGPAATNAPGNKLYHNRGGGTFEDVTDQTKVAGNGAYGMGCACADFDGDGNVDIYVTNLGENILYRNNGDGTFSDVTEMAGVGDTNWSTSAAFVDYDGDGHLDLVIANYIRWAPGREIECYSRGGRRDYCSPMNYQAPAIDTLYHNRGDGRFENVTRQAGLDKAYGNGLGVACGDFNHDGRVDLFIANDAMPNQLWINQGNGRFIDEAMIRGCAVNYLGIAEAGMGALAVDLNQDGWLDLFVTHLENEANRLYMNTNGYFTDTVTPKGPGALSWPFTGFGLGIADFDHDGNFDLYVANGKVKFGAREYDEKDPYAEPNQLLRGIGNGDFEEIVNAGTREPLNATSRGVALGDLDNDGDIDVVVVNKDGSVHLLWNVTAKRGRWIMLRVRDRRGTDAVGAMIRLEAGGKVRWRQVAPNEGYCSSNDPHVHFGLGDVSIVSRVTVRWLDAKEEEFGPFDVDRPYELRQGTGRRVRPASSSD